MADSLVLSHISPRILLTQYENYYVSLLLELHLIEGQLVTDEEQQPAIVSTHCDYTGTIDLRNVEEEQLELEVRWVEGTSQSFCGICVGDVGVALLDPSLELSSDGGGKQHCFVEMGHASDPSGVGVGDMNGLLGGDVEDAHILNEGLRVREGVVDVLPLMVVVVVLQVTGQLRQRPVEHIIQGLGLEVELKEVNDIAVPQHEVILASRFEPAQLAGEMVRNGADEIEPADRMLVVSDKLVLLLAVFGVLAGNTQLEVAAESVGNIVVLFLEAALAGMLGIYVASGLGAPCGLYRVTLPWFWFAHSTLIAHSALITYISRAALATNARHLSRRVVEIASALLVTIAILSEFTERFLSSSSLHQLLND